MRNIGTKTIETDRLILRKPTVDDAEAIFNNWANDPIVTKHLSWEPHKSIDVTREYLNNKLEKKQDDGYMFDWLVILKETNEIIGEITAVKVSVINKFVEMGHCYGRKYWNKGYATEALKAFIQYMFKLVGVEKVIACHSSENPASGKVMIKAGMHYDAALPKYVVDKASGKRVDLLYYSIDNK